MNLTQLSDNFWVSPQISEEEVLEAKQQGFEVIVCNRPDGESPDQTTSELIQQATESAGLEYHFLPMQGPNFTQDYLDTIQSLNQSGKKVLAYCRSGNRSSILFNASNS